MREVGANSIVCCLILFAHYRNEYVEGTTNRIVTIVGSPICAQTAHTLIVHKIQQELLNKSD